MNITTTGYYMIHCSSMGRSGLDMYAYVYNKSFQPNYPTENLVPSDYFDFGLGKILITVALQSSIDYIFVFTTKNQNQKGPFLLSALGPGSISLSSINISSKN